MGATQSTEKDEWLDAFFKVQEMALKSKGKKVEFPMENIVQS